MNTYFVYIVASKRNGTLYVGVTNDLIKRVYEHKTDLVDGLTKKYSVHKLVYYEPTPDIYGEVEREKWLKKWSRKRKIRLIEKFNPNCKDFYEEVIG